MLIAAFKIQHLRSFVFLERSVSRLQLCVAFAYGIPACAGVEPDVENVSLVSESLPAAVSTNRAGRKQRRDIRCVPCLSAMLLEQLHYLAVERRVQDGFLAAFAQEDSNGHAPDALAADAPVGARGDHVGCAPCPMPGPR